MLDSGTMQTMRMTKPIKTTPEYKATAATTSWSLVARVGLRLIESGLSVVREREPSAAARW